MAQNFEPLVAAAVDGRTENVYHRQTQLQKLCKAIQDEAPSIQDAITTDQGYTVSEAATEYYATVTCIRDAYQSLDPTKHLDEEYAIAKGRNSPNHRRPVGVVYIEPIRHTFFFSVFSPLVSAIAAGNCVVVLLERNLTASNALVRRLLASALEKDTFAIAERPLSNGLPTTSTIQVLQNSGDQLPRLHQLASNSGAPVVALVDRTADLQVAAQALVAARFAFGGKGPYAPDIVAVNEFVQQDFLRAVVQACVGYGKSPQEAGKSHCKRNPTSGVESALDELRKTSDSLRVVVQNDHFAVVEATSQKLLSGERLQAPILVVQSVRSVDDGIELFNRRVSGCCNAAYYFSNPETGKYLCQFVLSEVSFVNQIPGSLLLGPLSPARHSVDPDRRYPIELFTVPAAQYAVTSPQSARITAVLQNNEKETLSQLNIEIQKPLETSKRSGGGGIGFFEQGLLLNVGLILTGAVTTTVAAVICIRRFLQ